MSSTYGTTDYLQNNHHRLSAAMQRAQMKAEQALIEMAEKEAKTPVPFMLPGIQEHLRAIPNYIARTGIFAPIRRGWHCIHDDTLFLEGRHILLRGSGKQLTEDHADVWMHAMFLQSCAILGEAPVMNRAAFLRDIGKPTGGTQYDWLHEAMHDLARFTLRIEARRPDGSIKYSYGNQPSTRVLPMIGGFDYDPNGKSYTLFMDPRWAQLYGNREYALVDWSKRLQMRHDLSKSLQRLIGTSADIQQKYSLAILKQRAHYTGRMRDFRATLERSLLELEELKVIDRARIETTSRDREMAIWTRL